MSNKVGKRLMPELRFPEFRASDAWNEIELGKAILLEYGNSLPESARAGGRFPVVGSNGVVGFHDFAITKGPAIVIGRKGSAGQVNWIESDCYPIDTTFFVKNLLPADLLMRFLFLLLVNCKLEKLKDDGAVPGINRNSVYTLKPFAPSWPEQEKIADCLSSLEDLIAAQSKKIEALKAHKKGLMQQLFPAEGETVPRLMFSKFTNAGEWKAKKIANILEKVSNPVDVQSNDFYREIGIRSHGKGIFHKEMVSGTQLGDKRVFWVEKNTLVLNIVFAWEQAVATVSKDEAGMIASHRFPMFKGKNKTSVEFVKCFLLTNKGKYLLGLASPGGAGRNRTLGRKEFENLEFHVPADLDEQVLIADALSSLDALIFAHTQKLDILNTHKKGLMQGLFPSVDEAEA